MVARLKARFPHSLFVGSGYSYLQEYLPHVGQALVRAGMVDFIGLGRMVLSYPDLPCDVLQTGQLQRPRHLPHVFRLHDCAAQRHDLRLLSPSTRFTRSARKLSVLQALKKGVE